MVCVNLTHCIFGELRSSARTIAHQQLGCGRAETVRDSAVWADTTRRYPVGQEGV
jgi:hypothetical protein